MHFLYRHEMQNITPQLKRILISHITGLSTAQLLAEPNLQLTEEQQKWLDDATIRLQNNEPLQHILGYSEFYGRKFKSDSRALVPRPETEELVEWILNDWSTLNSQLSTLNLLDIGTGTGCIALSLAKVLPEAKVSALDISKEALSLARENANILEVKNVDFIEGDILNKSFNSQLSTFNLIVSNPPYVRECEKAEMEANVLDYDPHTALFVSDEDPLIFYRAIGEFALTHLKNGGALYFEINQYLGRETCDMLVAMGYRNVEMREDVNGNARMVKATL
ncbi:MAG: peptide chain release factor N(5)-glutamine methyltransferase [Paludibacteraceae bacterium]|nr:peptide chain release factor N(5)-glutamine methyltransferase [Paludibacteraceae bacterium]